MAEYRQETAAASVTVVAPEKIRPSTMTGSSSAQMASSMILPASLAVFLGCLGRFFFLPYHRV